MEELTSNMGSRTIRAMCRVALMIGAFVLLLPLSARSEIKQGSLEVGLFGGMNFFEKHQNLKDRSVYGGWIGYNFTRHFGIECALQFISSRVDDRTKTVANEGEFAFPMDKVDLTFYGIEAIYYFKPDGKLNPFVIAGFGLAHYDPTISTKDMASINVGVGAKYWVSDNFALRADLRNNMVTEVFQETYHNIQATVGITVAFGGKERRVPVQAVVEPKPEPVPVVAATPEPEADKPIIYYAPEIEAVIIIASEPEVEEKVMALAGQPRMLASKIIVLAFEDIHFEFDSSVLTSESRAILKRNIKILNENPEAKIRIAGYTSASGTKEYNQKLSERRANAVMEYLAKENVVTPDRLSVIGFGETNPATYEAAPKDLYSPAAKSNMRVLFEIIVE